MKTPTTDQLEDAYNALSVQYEEIARICAYVLKVELNRRRNAGRPASKLTRREQNRQAQRRFRAKQREQKHLSSKQK